MQTKGKVPGQAPDQPGVLIVDDDAAVRSFLKAVFLLQRCSVTAAQDGNEAIDLLEKGDRFDMIVTDLQMPGKNGLEVVRAARAALPQAGVLLISGGVIAPEARQEAQRLGVEILGKPVGVGALKALLARHVGAREKERGSSDSGSSRKLERRRVRRFGIVGCPVDIQRAGASQREVGHEPIMDAVGYDLSELGMGIVMSGSLAPGEIVRIVGHLGKMASPLEAKGTVVWCHQYSSAEDEPRVGIAWVSLDPEQRRQVRDLRALLASEPPRDAEAV